MGKEQELLEAARNGNLAIVERILNHRIRKSGPLASLRRGPGPNTQDASGYTCLHHAALNGHKNVVSILLQHDANPNIVDNKGSTALHLAAWTGNYDIVHVILTQSSSVPNVNLKNNDQETPLHSAAQYGHTSVVSLLLQHGSDPLIRNVKEESPLELASQYGRYETVDVLLRTRPNLVHDLIKKHSPLHLAAKNGHRNVVRLLLNAKFDVNYLTEKGTALHEAALYGKLEVVKLLLDYGIDVELEDEQRRTVSDLLQDINTNIAKQTKKVIKEHTTLVCTEDDSSTVISDSSSHCISPPPGYTDTTPEHSVLLPEKVLTNSTQSQSPTSGFTSPANSEFNFYEVPPPPRLSLQMKRSSGDEYIQNVPTKNFFSRSQDSILDGYSTSSSRSPSFLDYETPPPLPPRDKLISTRVCKSADASHLLYEIPPVPSPVNGNYPCSTFTRRDSDLQRPDSQSSTGTWSNHSSSGYMPMTGKPVPPVKPPRKSVSPLNRALSQQQYHSKSQHQLHIQPNRTSVCEYMSVSAGSDSGMKRSASNDGEGYVEMRSVVGANSRFSTFFGDTKTDTQPIYANQNSVNESAFSVLYDQIANGSSNYGTSAVPIPSDSSKSSSLCRSHNSKVSKPPALHQRSKSEHHPRCPNFESMKRENKNDADEQKNKRATVQIPVDGYQSFSNANYSLPSRQEAEKGIKIVMKKLNKNTEKNDTACVNGWSQSPQSSDSELLCNYPDYSDSDYDFDSCSSSDDYLEYKRLLKPSKDAETFTDETLFQSTNSKGLKVNVKLRNSENKTKCRTKSVKADIIFDGIVKEDNPFAGLCRGSVHSKTSMNSEVSVEDRKPKRGKYCANTLERKRKFKTLPSKLKHTKSEECDKHKPMTIEIKPIEMPVSSNNNWESFPRLMQISPFDENKEWAEIENIMASFGSGLEKEIVFSDEEKDSKEAFSKSVKDWLLELSLEKYTDLFFVNGFDDLNFMGPNVMEDSDLQDIGIESEEQRKKLLESAKYFPVLKQLEKDAVLTVDQWLHSLHLDEYMSRFQENGYIDMSKVRSIWDIELNAVLEINKIGHRKRILCSLGERLSLMNDLDFADLDFNKLVSSILERRSASSCDLSKFSPPRKKANDENETSLSASDGFTSNRSSNQSMISSVPLSTQWKHSPFDLYKNKCEYKASYLGSTLVRHLQGIQSSNESIKKLKESTKNIQKVPQVILSIDYTGVKFIDAQTNVVVCEHEIRNIHFACQDADDFKHFAYITKEHETDNNYCHVFCAPTLDLATEVILTLGQAFEIAYRLALGEDIQLLNQIFEANQITSAPPAPPPRTSSFIVTSVASSNTSTCASESTSNSTIQKSSIPKPVTNTNNNKNGDIENKPIIVPKPKPRLTTESKIMKPKPVPPVKPLSLLKTCQSPANSLKRGNL
ncbi:ankyrin repeat and SAM domain-containing protein 1A-like protein [Leptotrombidium deliense]|uniref:Ankyrin repeat and SAM domain-containing protein 1A-like protein n=1 Tax=Leptotrombidium deliense TaxID=299467 RepID=A0A443SPS4_9ACAR|nr:ankyrin repeat and SAM domain-containing protein 1A-like protein [Leptotrombidium deliense]